MRKIKTGIMVILMLALLWGLQAQAGSIVWVDDSVSGSNLDMDIALEVQVENEPRFDYGQRKNINFKIKFRNGMSSEGITDVKFHPITANDSVTYPFEIENQDISIQNIPANQDFVSKDISFKARNDVLSGYRTIGYQIYFKYAGKQYYYQDEFHVNINGNPDLNNGDSSSEPTTSDPSEKNDIKIFMGVNQSTPVCVYGQPVEITLTLLNNGGNTANGVVITPVVDADSDVFPFEIQQMNYSRDLETLIGTGVQQDAASRTKTVKYAFVTRQKVTSGYKKVSFQIDYYTDALIDKTITKDIYVMVKGNPEMDAEAETGEDGEAKTSIPRVIVSGYTTKPKDILAGDSFEITLRMTNTSKQTAVSNMVFDIQSENFTIDTTSNATAAAFLPVSGSSSIFVDRIGPEETKEISIEMTARTDLSPRPYVLNVKMDYEDGKKNTYESTASVSVPVKQKDKMEISSPEIMPESIDVGGQANIMFSIYNTGKTQLYNVMVRFKGDSIEETECFVGNVAAGATGSVDTMLTGIAATVDDGTLIAEITYENQSGESLSVEKEYTLYVNEFIPGDDMFIDGDMGMGEMEEPQKNNLPLIIGGIAAVLAAAGAAAFVIIKKKKAKVLELLESEDIDEV